VLTAWATTFIGVTARAIWFRRRARRLTAQNPIASSVLAVQPGTTKATTPTRRLLRLVMPGWKCRPVFWCGMLTGGVALKLVVTIKVNSEIGVLGALLARGEWALLFRRQLGYALWAVPAAGLGAFQKYAASQATLSMRLMLTEQVHARYAAAQSLPVALAQTDAAVQRGVSDTQSFCAAAIETYESLAKPIIEVTLLSAKLASMMGGAQLVQCYSFFLMAGLWTRFVNPAIATMIASVQQSEGELLAHHARLVEYAEEIALLSGVQTEAAMLNQTLATLASRTRQLDLQRFGSESLDTYVLRYLGILSAFTAMLPAAARGSSPGFDPTEYFLTVLHLLVNVGMACKDIFAAFKSAATMRGLASRIEPLLTALEQPLKQPAAAADLSGLSTGPSDHAPSSSVLEVDNLTITSPDGAVLVKGLSLRLSSAQRLLVRGPNGCGKTSLVRVLGGIWRASTGSVSALTASEVMTLPQRPYIVGNGTIKQQLLYPATSSTSDATSSLWNASDESLLQALEWAGLSYLAPTAASLHERGRADSLSGGEQQRLSAARMLLRKPKVALLDEPTSACEQNFERTLFGYCMAQSLTVVTVAHRPELATFHTHELLLDGHGSFTLTEIEAGNSSAVMVGSSSGEDVGGEDDPLMWRSH